MSKRIGISRVTSSVLPAACRDYAKLWIGGEWTASSSGERLACINPTDGKEFFAVARASEADIDDAVSAATVAAPRWRDMDSIERGRILRRTAELIRENAQNFGILDTLNVGRPIRDTTHKSANGVARLFEFYAGLTDKLWGRTIPLGREYSGRVDYEPYGVVGAISPWNYPLSNAATKIAPILACGNAVVLKPAEQAPLSALLLAAVLHEAGVPAGVVNVVPGFGHDAGQALVAHAGVPKISFTGSTATGRAIGAKCGALLKSVTLELGGKSPNIVFADADLRTAAKGAVFTVFNNQGQTCTAGTRLIVQRSIADEFLALVREAARPLTIGDPMIETTKMGPLVSRGQLDRVKEYVDGAVRGGANLERLEVASYDPVDGGFFHPPVVFTDASSDLPISKDEIFGPVLTVFTFEAEDEAYRLANATDYGLAAIVWTNSHRQVEMARHELQAGIVWVNCAHVLNPGIPVGGHKTSGVGLEYGVEAMTQYMRTKSCVIASGGWRSGLDD